MFNFNKNKVLRNQLSEDEQNEIIQLFNLLNFSNANEFNAIYNYFDFQNHQDELLIYLRLCKEMGNHLSDTYGRNRSVENYLSVKYGREPLFVNGEINKNHVMDNFANELNIDSYNIVTNNTEYLSSRKIKNIYEYITLINGENVKSGEIKSIAGNKFNGENVKPGEIKSIAGNKFNGQNVEKVENFRKLLTNNYGFNISDELVLLTEFEAKATNRKILPNSPSVVLNCPPDKYNDGWHLENYYALNHTEEIEQVKKKNSEKEKADEEQRQNLLNEQLKKQEIEEQLAFGITVLPAFSFFNDKGESVTIENGIVKEWDEVNHKYLIENENSFVLLKPSELYDIFNPSKEIEEIKNEKQVLQKESDAVVFADPDNPEKGTLLPTFSLIDDMRTQGKIKSFENMKVYGYNEELKTYKLSNGKETVELLEREFKDLITTDRLKQKKMENEPSWKRLLESQYIQYFKERDNTANNFIHNLSVYCRKEANNPIEAVKVAEAIISKMDPAEKEKTKKLFESRKQYGQNQAEYITSIYSKAIKEFPFNEDYIKNSRFELYRPIPVYDEMFEKGYYIENDKDLIKHNPMDLQEVKNRNLRIGDELNNLTVKVDKTFGLGKDTLNFDNLTIVSASKEKNSITVMDKNKSMLVLPRDEVLESWKKQQMILQKVESRRSQSKSMGFEMTI